MPERQTPESKTPGTDPCGTQSAQEKEGHGTVPNVPPTQAGTPLGEAKEALHELEEKKGDWAE